MVQVMGHVRVGLVLAAVMAMAAASLGAAAVGPLRGGELVGLAADPSASRLAVDVAQSELDRRTYVVDLATGASTVLPFPKRQRCRMLVQEWSPDGRSLLSIVETDSGTEAWVLNVGGGEGVSPALRLHGPQYVHQMVWSPDGARIAVLGGTWRLLTESVYRDVTVYHRDGSRDTGFRVTIPGHLHVEGIDW